MSEVTQSLRVCVCVSQVGQPLRVNGQDGTRAVTWRGSSCTHNLPHRVPHTYHQGVGGCPISPPPPTSRRLLPCGFPALHWYQGMRHLTHMHAHKHTGSHVSGALAREGMNARQTRTGFFFFPSRSLNPMTAEFREWRRRQRIDFVRHKALAGKGKGMMWAIILAACNNYTVILSERNTSGAASHIPQREKT